MLDGFTIDNQNQAMANCLTRGISITSNATPTLKNLLVKSNNTTTDYVDGAGIYINGGSATIETSTIGDATLQNTCDDGCGIYAEALSAPLTITGTTITENTGGDNTSGTGITLVNNGSQVTTISGSTLSNNSASDSGMLGGTIYATGASSSISLTSTDFPETLQLRPGERSK